MAGIELFNRIKQLDQDKILTEVWEDTLVQDKIIELNTIEQLFKKSQRSDDSLLPTYALSAYKRAKGSLAPTDRINLRLSGDFYSTFDVIPNATGFSIDANTNLYPDSGNFIELYGIEILGLRAGLT
jgi:hypothetical protein